MKESDLFEPVKQFLLNTVNCEKVYAEVIDLDVVGKHGNVYIGIEMKTSLNFKVIEQAVGRKHLVDYMFILVPKPKNRHPFILIDWLKDLGVGLLYYNADPHTPPISVNHWGKRQHVKNDRHNTISHYIDEEIHLVNIGGSKGGETLTPYKNTMDKIKNHLYFAKVWQTIDEILSKVETHYSNPKPSTMATLKAVWNQEWIEFEYIDGKQHYRMKEEYREAYWNEFHEQLQETRQLRRANRLVTNNA